jgi:hypothetical protein
MKKSVLTFFLSMVPTITTIFLLIEFFPYTGLGRIVSIPLTLFFNSCIVLIGLLITHFLKSRIIKSSVWIAITLTSMFIAIVLHPQEFLPSILIQIREMIFSNVN